MTDSTFTRTTDTAHLTALVREAKRTTLQLAAHMLDALSPTTRERIVGDSASSDSRLAARRST